MGITLELLEKEYKQQFIKYSQMAFQKAYSEEFGVSDELALPKNDIENSINSDNAVIYRIIHDGDWVGGIILSIHKTTHHNSLDLFFINPDCHSKGIGTKVWAMVEKLYPETKIWETITPYFEKRNIHFYVNKCGFKIVVSASPF